ncbi:protein phosphatase 1 regulatory subunit 36 [Rhinophrynus dorsalis]
MSVEPALPPQSSAKDFHRRENTGGDAHVGFTNKRTEVSQFINKEMHYNSTLKTIYTITRPTPGHWFWKEDSKSLEFSRAASSNFLTAPGPKPSVVSDKNPKSLRQEKKRDHEHITLQDVKCVALNMLQEEERHYITSFSSAARTQHIDDFLMALLYYLSCYVEKHALERKPKSLMLSPSIFETKEMNNVLARMEQALKHFAHMYCTLVLGDGMIEQHHMACGKNKASATSKDRRFYECLYRFCIYVAWVVFRRKDLSVIEAEVGRLLRSDTFNPALRPKDAPEESGRNLFVEKKTPKKTATYAQSRTENNKRPSIKSIIEQRSPALISLIPSPKEKSHYLFHQHELHPSSSCELTDNKNWVDVSPALIPPRIGILGEPLKHFHLHSLTPIGTDEEEETVPSERKSVASFYSRGLSSHHSILRPGTSRQSTVISRATTEAAYSDTD